MFSLKIVHWNCFKLTVPRIEELNLFINDYKPDIISLQEIKISEELVNFRLRFKGYSTFHKVRTLTVGVG